MEKSTLIFIGGMVAGAGLFKAGEVIYNHFSPEEDLSDAEVEDEVDEATEDIDDTDLESAEPNPSQEPAE